MEPTTNIQNPEKIQQPINEPQVLSPQQITGAIHIPMPQQIPTSNIVIQNDNCNQNNGGGNNGKTPAQIAALINMKIVKCPYCNMGTLKNKLLYMKLLMFCLISVFLFPCGICIWYCLYCTTMTTKMSTEQQEKPIDKSPNGRFLKFDEELGRGSFKTVYRGLDTETGIAVAWCELQEDKLNKQEKQRFREEAAMLKDLEHSSIVKFYDYWENHNTGKNKCIVLVTELMTSGTLKLYIKRFKTINVKILKSWCKQILRGLNFLHTRNPPVIHRDLKCDNIFITGTTGSVKIGDLGLSTFKNMSHAKSVIGTPEFMAPEMYEEMYDEAVDVYAFGMCLLEMVTGEYPYAECDFPVKIYKKVSCGIKPDCFDKIPEDYAEVKDIIDRCIRFNKDERMTISQLLQHEFFSQEDHHGIKLEIKSKDEDIDSSNCKMHLTITDPKKRLEYKLNDGEGLQIFFDYMEDSVEDLVDQLIEQHHVPEGERKILTKKIKDKVNLLKKELELKQISMNKKLEQQKSEELADVSLNNVTSNNTNNEKTNNDSSTKQSNTTEISTDLSGQHKHKKTITNRRTKKGRFDITTINIAPTTFVRTSSIPEGTVDEIDIAHNNTIVMKNIDSAQNVNDNVKEKTDNNIPTHQTYAEVLRHNTEAINQTPQTEHENVSKKPLETKAGKHITFHMIPNSVNYDSTEYLQENIISNSEPVTINNPGVQNFISYENPHTTKENTMISKHEDIRNTMNKNENNYEERPTNKDLNSSIHDLELELRKLSGVCGVKLKGDYENGFKTDPPKNTQRISEDSQIISQQATISNQNAPMPGPVNVVAQHKHLETCSGFSVEDLSYLLKMAQQQIVLQQQFLLTAIEGKASMTKFDQYISFQKGIQNHNNSKQLPSNYKETNQNDNISSTAHCSPEIQNISSPEYSHSLIESKKTVKTEISNNSPTYHYNDGISSSQTPYNHIHHGPNLEAVDRKLQSFKQTQKISNDNVSHSNPVRRKHSRNHLLEDKRKEAVTLNQFSVTNSLHNQQQHMPPQSTNTQTFESSIISKDCSHQSLGTCCSTDESYKKLPNIHYNLTHTLPQEVDDVLNYQNSINSSRNSSIYKNSHFSCHSSEHYSTIDADVNVIEREMELYKIDKLVSFTLEKHKKELLELRNRQCNELREIKHLSSLINLKAQELVRQMNIENEDVGGKKNKMEYNNE
uniref:non-specific serine/threonine protein kinase n=1 Tax=Parastrongyloides trichosuri TaxID=131310 RepID=A0A0N4ZKI2_PARTI